LVLTSSNDSTAKLWNSTSGLCLRTFIGHSHHLTSAMFSFDDNAVITASFDHTCKVWTLTGECTLTLTGHTAEIMSVCQAPVSFTTGR
jgi:WD40 repeat protein